MPPFHLLIGRATECLVRECLVRECLGLDCLVLEYLVTECLVLECLVTECLVLECLVTECLVLECLVRECLITKCLFFYCQQLAYQLALGIPIHFKTLKLFNSFWLSLSLRILLHLTRPLSFSLSSPSQYLMQSFKHLLFKLILNHFAPFKIREKCSLMVME